jgi:hypothetical protein
MKRGCPRFTPVLWALTWAAYPISRFRGFKNTGDGAVAKTALTANRLVAHQPVLDRIAMHIAEFDAKKGAVQVQSTGLSSFSTMPEIESEGTGKARMRREHSIPLLTCPTI